MIVSGVMIPILTSANLADNLLENLLSRSRFLNSFFKEFSVRRRTFEGVSFSSSAKIKKGTLIKSTDNRGKLKLNINCGVVNERIKYPNNAIDLIASYFRMVGVDLKSQSFMKSRLELIFRVRLRSISELPQVH